MEMNSLHTVTPAAHMPAQEFPTLIALFAGIFRRQETAPSSDQNRSLSIKSCCPANWLLNSGELGYRHIAEKWCTIFNMARQGQG
jgi:hypothetical protein